MINKVHIRIFIGLIVIILAALGIAMGNYWLRPTPVATAPQPESVLETPTHQNAPAEMTEEDREFLRQLDEAISQAKEQEAISASQPAPYQPRNQLKYIPEVKRSDGFKKKGEKADQSKAKRDKTEKDKVNKGKKGE